MEQFTKLPMELRGKIFATDPGILKESQLVSKSTKKAASKYFYEEYCKKLTSIREIKTYISNTNKVLIASRLDNDIIINYRENSITNSGDLYVIYKFNGLMMADVRY